MSSPIRPRLRYKVICPLSLLVALAFALPAEALRVVDYNILNYPGSTGTARAPYYRTVLGPLGADVIVTEEIASASGPTQFLNEVLNVMEPGEWATVPFIDGNDTDASLFYKPAKVQFLGQWAFYPNPSNHLRFVHVYRLMPVGYTSQSAELRLYTAHLKASTGYESQRLAECIGMRDSMNVMPPGTHALICGDMNFYTQAAEPGYAKLLESQANNTGRVYDLLPAGAWHDGAAFAPYHTQSPCLSGACASGGATGGMDDRFDMILPTYSLVTGQGLGVIPGTCVPVGNDGLHLNHAITDAPVIPEGAAYASALQLSSDHLPVRVDLRLPAEIAADTLLVFGPAIVGAPPQGQAFWVENPAVPPADSLNCVFTVTAGFGAPSPLAIPAGGSAAAVATIQCSTSGEKSGDLTITSDAPDDPIKTVHLAGTILDHASASLDSTAALLSSNLNFGDHQPGSFGTRSVRIFNLGYDPLQARLLISAATLAGGGGRFSIVGGFTSHLVAGSGQDYALAFDDAGAPSDSTYTAVLTFTTFDEPLPGAAAQPDLVVSLRARVIQGQDGVGEPASPLITRLYPPSPNPLSGSSSVRLNLAGPAYGTLAVFDPAGRLVSVLRNGSLAPGRYVTAWNGRNEAGAPVASGVYFVRFSANGYASQTVRLAVIR